MVAMKTSARCLSKFIGLGVIAGSLALAFPLSAQTCVQEMYSTVNKQKLNCTANDVSIAEVTHIRDPLTGTVITTCQSGQTFNFLADFKIVTTSSQARENVGLYIATDSQTTALTGKCADNIISPQHHCKNGGTGINCGSSDYHETDASPDNCGDTSSSDSGGTGVEIVTLEIDNFLCQAPAGTNQVQLPNCTSWQIPGGTIQCNAPDPDYLYPFNGTKAEAIPGSPAKCNCSIIPLGITAQTPSINVAKACTVYGSTPSDAVNFTDIDHPSPVSCSLNPEGGDVTYTVDMLNDKSNFGDVIIDQICDSAYGTVYRSNTFAGSACPAGSVVGGSIKTNNCTSPTAIALNASEQCTFIVTQAEATTVVNTVSIVGHGSTAGTFGPTQSNEVTVASHEAATTGTITKTWAANEAACATVRYNVEVKNTSASGTDETLNLSGLSDSAFASITSVHDDVLGTTCGVASGSHGLGTLSSVTAGSTNGGALPVTIPVDNGTYKCQFDGKFCGGLDASGCFTHLNTISATLTGDEGETVSLTAGSVNVKECLQETTIANP